MSKLTDKVLGCMASTAEEAFIESMGYASRGGMHEPEMPEEVKEYRSEHTSRLERLFDKITR